MSTFFLDIEASSLMLGSFPIEIAWVDADGTGEAHLIRPELSWTDWDPRAQQVHGILPEVLMRDGEPADVVARRVAEVLSGHDVYSDAPGFDVAWLDVLLGAADLPPRAVQLQDVQTAYGRACTPLFEDLPPKGGPRHAIELTLRRRRALQIVAAAGDEEERRGPRKHRALQDAECLWRTWLGIRRRVAEASEG